LALAIGANTTIFSVAKPLLIDRLDVPHAANLRLLTWTDANVSYPKLASAWHLARSHGRC
jgi:hypothetical protein